MRNEELYNSPRWEVPRTMTERTPLVYCGLECTSSRFFQPCRFCISEDRHLVDWYTEDNDMTDEQRIINERNRCCKESVERILDNLYTKDAVPVLLGEYGEW